MPSALFAYRDRPLPSGAAFIPTRDDVIHYLENIVDAEGLDDRMVFGHSISRIDRTDEGRWRLSGPQGEIQARYVVVATGTTGEPRRPALPGLETFPGAIVHTAEWPEHLPTAGRRIVVVGTGASAIQLVPKLAADAASLHVVQRTPRWILPRPGGHLADKRGGLLGHSRMRSWLGAVLERYVDRRARALMTYSDDAARADRRRYSAMLARSLRGSMHRPALTPVDPWGCSRTLFSSDFYPALDRPNVTLVSGSVERIEGQSIILSNGEVVAADMIVFATGFDRFARAMRIHGVDGELYTRWASDPAAYLGVLVAGFPNLVHLSGPNTGILNSAPRVLDVQARFAAQLIARAGARGRFEVEAELQAQEVAQKRRRLEGALWSRPECRSWYSAQHAVNAAIYPGRLADYERQIDSAPYDRLVSPAAGSSRRDQ